MSKAAIIKAAYKVAFKVRKCSPHILVGVGVVGTVTSTVLACKATTKISEILEQTKGDVDIIHAAVEDKTLEVEYNEEDAKKDLAITYAKAGVQITKLYAPAVLLGVASIGCILTSHNILNKRNVALAAAYAGIDKAFKDYRSRVIERFGEAADKEIKYGIKAKTITDVEIDEETGKEKKVKKTVDVIENDVTFCSPYAKFFDEASRNWTDSPHHNLSFLRGIQNYANDKLKAQGYLFLSDVYNWLDIPETQPSRRVGWVYDEKNPVGDNYVDFDIYDIHDERKRAFVNGYEPSILLDFNVDGVIDYILAKK